MKTVNPQNQKSYQPASKEKVKKTAPTYTIINLLRDSKKGKKIFKT